MKYLLEKKGKEMPQDEDNSDANEEPIGAEFDDSDNEIKRPARKKRKVQGIQEVAQAPAIDAGRRNGYDSRNKFEERLNALKEFKRKHGRCNVPKAYKDGNNLGLWVQRTRSMKSGSRQNSGVYKLTNERIKNLENIGFLNGMWCGRMLKYCHLKTVSMLSKYSNLNMATAMYHMLIMLITISGEPY